MKKLLLSPILIFIALASFSQNQENNEVDSINIRQIDCHTVKYKLFPTENMWTFIKLNTQNGKMWQVQFDVEEDNRFETYLNPIPLLFDEKLENERFTLYPTQNMFNFILLDQIDGRTWQVQWSTEAKYRWIVAIESLFPEE